MSPIVRRLTTLRNVVRARGFRGVWSTATTVARPLARDVRRMPRVLAARLRHGRPRLVLSFHGGIGDDLVCTVLLRELRRRDYGPVWMLSRYADLFERNDDVAVVLPWTRSYRSCLERLGWDAPDPRYFRYERGDDRARLVAPERHMITVMCGQVGIVGPIVRRPYLTLRDDERAAGLRVPRQVVIQSSGLEAGTPMLNKQWSSERFQEVVRALKSDFNFVQLGAPSDPPLDGVLDLRGRTSRRQSAAILSRSLALVGNVGFLMHLARAVECRSVIVYGGRERPDQSGYSCNENLYSAVPCAPCWRRSSCDHGRRCLHEIGADGVVAAVRRAAARHGTPLEEDTDVITPAQLEPPLERRYLPSVAITTRFGGRRRVEAKILGDVRVAAAPGERETIG